MKGLSTQVAVGVAAGLKHDSSIHCDELVSLPKAVGRRILVSAMQRPRKRDWGGQP